jgi:hypothetical protein
VITINLLEILAVRELGEQDLAEARAARNLRPTLVECDVADQHTPRSKPRPKRKAAPPDPAERRD